MEMFDAHRRDILNFDNYMDLKKPGFGGPDSAIALRDNRGNLIDKTPKLDGYRRTVERDPAFSHNVYDPTYKAMTHDLVYKQEKKKPFTYDDARTGIPVVEIEPLKEGKTYTSFERFINEAIDDELEDEMAEDEPTDEYLEDDTSDIEYEPRNWEESEEDREREEEETRAEATRSNITISDLRQIEDELRKFEEGDFDDEEEFGANPIDTEEDTPFGEEPDWVKELRNKQD